MANGADREPQLLESGQFDLVLVNILARVILGMIPALGDRLSPGGRLVTAGLIESQEEEVVASLQAAGLQVIERTQEQDWVCLVAQHR
jgi:ribosomal protein L11 methyltransferase